MANFEVLQKKKKRFFYHQIDITQMFNAFPEVYGISNTSETFLSLSMLHLLYGLY